MKLADTPILSISFWHSAVPHSESIRTLPTLDFYCDEGSKEVMADGATCEGAVENEMEIKPKYDGVLDSAMYNCEYKWIVVDEDCKIVRTFLDMEIAELVLLHYCAYCIIDIIIYISQLYNIVKYLVNACRCCAVLHMNSS